MLEDSITKDLVDSFPVSCDQALLIQVDEVAFDLFSCSRGMLSTGKVITNLVPLHLLKAVTKGLQLLHFAFAQQLFDDL